MRRTEETRRAQGAFAVAAEVRGADAPIVRPWLVRTALVLTGVGLLTASAHVSVPFYPVPLTLQTLAVLLLGGVLGPRMGVAAVTSYLALGLAGAPVFHNGLGGLLAVAGPTWGYLMGFVPAAYLMGVVGRKGWAASSQRMGLMRKAALVLAGATMAEVAIYALGLSWLAFTTGMGGGAVAAVGLLPFLLGDLVKMAIAVMVVCGAKNLLERWGARPL